MLQADRESETDIDSDTLTGLKRRFDGLRKRLKRLPSESNINTDSCPSSLDKCWNNCWKNIYSHYTQSHRYYHTLTHLEHMFGHFDKVESLLTEPVSVALAIWYHDIIYQPAHNDNERQSADYFKQQLAKHLPPQLTSRVESLIMMTADHQLQYRDGNDCNDSAEQDASYFLDMDLAILGADWTTYFGYAKQVRLEYQQVALVDYNRARSAVLNGFLQRDRLYFSKQFFDKYEQQARENIKREIDFLNKQLIHNT